MLAAADFFAAAAAGAGLVFLDLSATLATFFAGLSAFAFLTGLSALTGFVVLVFLLVDAAAGFLAFFGDVFADGFLV